ncbi:hypothetical protein GALL_542680 [mine drainage metagenome]|uniref:Uncharacterized protein n=1 Tax=mine drainage metagenome TaxID=410659 RepID=A0A1J5P8Q5_9ZZZZ
MSLQREGKPDLADLPLNPPSAAILQQTRDLHRQGRAARDDVPLWHRLKRGAGKGVQIDARMAVEPPVLICNQQLQIVGIDLRRFDRKSPHAIVGGKGTQQGSVARQHLDRRHRQ